MDSSIVCTEAELTSRPFVWIRPAAYMVPGKLTTIRSLLHDSKYYPQHVIPITDTPRRYLMLKSTAILIGRMMLRRVSNC